ncbi:MAG: DUF1295 domain-containing protein [Fuerstiella sp.]|nr:DUF1295 domain-containing protein [Fuerstiella sp.]
MWTVSLPQHTGITLAESGRTPLHGAGIVLWTVSILFEAIGDLQLGRFKTVTENHEKVMIMNKGLWCYARHPNYFGDFLVCGACM